MTTITKLRNVKFNFDNTMFHIKNVAHNLSVFKIHIFSLYLNKLSD